MKRTPLKRGNKPMKRVSDKKKSQPPKESKDKLWEFFLNIWDNSEHLCMSCGKSLGYQPLSIFFDHLLEKSKYPEYEYDLNNIFLCCWDCHTLKTNGHPTETHQEAILAYKINIGL